MKKLLATLALVVALCGSMVFTACFDNGGNDTNSGDDQKQEQPDDKPGNNPSGSENEGDEGNNDDEDNKDDEGDGEEESNAGNETFAGSISVESYETKQAAAEAFLEKEISGLAVTAELVEYRATGELSESQIAQLEVGDVLDEEDEIVSVEVVEISYKTLSVERAAQDDELSVFTVYIIVYTPHGKTVQEFRYYVPKAHNGEVLTRSYYDDLLNPLKYLNCTQVYVLTASNVMKLAEPSINFEYDLISNTTYNYTIKVADDKASIDMLMLEPDVSILPPEPDMNDSHGSFTFPCVETSLLGYFEYSNGAFDIWASIDKGVNYVKSPTDTFAQYGITDIQSFASMCLPQLDYSYYEKTDYGFKIQEEFLNKYVEMSLESVIDSDAEVSAELQIYVVDGKISKMVSNVTAETNVQGFLMVMSSREELTFKDFGTTVVATPASIKA